MGFWDNLLKTGRQEVQQHFVNPTRNFVRKEIPRARDLFKQSPASFVNKNVVQPIVRSNKNTLDNMRVGTQNFFKPTTVNNKLNLRTRDVVREVGTQAKDIIQSTPRTAAALMISSKPFRQNTLTPTTKAEKFVFGNQPIKSIQTGDTSKYLQNKGLSPKVSNIVGGGLAIGSIALDVTGGGGVAKNIAKEGTEQGVRKLLGNTVKNYSDDAIKALAKEKNAGKVAEMLNVKKVVSPLSNEAKPYYWNNHDTKKFEIATGAKSVDVAPNIDSFVHKSPNGTWTVSEGKTGYKIAEGKNQNEAVNNAKAIFADIKAKGGLSPEEIVNQQVESLKKTNNDISPRYQAPRVGYREEAQKLYKETRAKGMSDAEAGKAIEPQVAKLRETYYKGNPIVEPLTPKVETPPITPKNTPQGIVAPPESNNVPLVKMMITNQDKANLRGLGYSDDLIKKMRPQEAADILAKGEPTVVPPIKTKNIADTSVAPAGKGKISLKKPSGFASTIAVKTPEIAKQIPGYTAITNKKTLNSAIKRVTQNPESTFQTLMTKGKNLNLKDSADAFVLITKYIEDGNLEAATTLAKKTAVNEREAGRIVQLASAYNKLTPEGALKDVFKNIQAFKDKTGKNIVIDAAKTKRITDLAKDVQKHKQGSREWQVAAALLEKEKANLIPQGKLGIISKLQTMAQLLNPKTAIRNIVGNSALDFFEDVSRVQAAGIDKALYKLGFIKNRNVVSPNLKTKWLGQLTGFKQGAEDVKLGIRTTGSQGQFEVTKDIFKPGSIGNKLEKALGYELSTFDKAFYTGRYQSSLENILKADGGKLKQWMVDQAEAEALYSTFQNNSAIANGLQKLKRGLNVGQEWGVGDLILKYPKTPGNIVSVGMDYSPIGFVKGLKQFYDSTKLLDHALQREAILNLSRGITGTGLILGGAMLAKQGIITGKAEKDADIRQTQREAGQGPFWVNLTALGRLLGGRDTKPQQGDTIVNYDWLQPNAIQLSMGANMILNKNVNDRLSDAWDSVGAGVDTITQQPVFSGVQRFVSNLDTSRGGGLGKAFGEAVKGTPASFIPTFLNQVGQVFDNTQRSTYDPNFAKGIVKTVQAKIPGARNLLEPKISPSTGKPLEQYQNGGNNLFNVFLNPAFVNKYKMTPEVKEVLDIYNRSGETQQAPRIVDTKIKVNGEDKTLTPKEVTEYQKFVGTRVQAEYSKLLRDQSFKNLSDEEKASKMASTLTAINKQAKIALFGQEDKKTVAKEKTVKVAKTKKVKVSKGKKAKKANITALRNFKTPTYSRPKTTGRIALKSTKISASELAKGR
jgi:hypothetical protein